MLGRGLHFNIYNSLKQAMPMYKTCSICNVVFDSTCTPLFSYLFYKKILIIRALTSIVLFIYIVYWTNFWVSPVSILTPLMSWLLLVLYMICTCHLLMIRTTSRDCINRRFSIFTRWPAFSYLFRKRFLTWHVQYTVNITFILFVLLYTVLQKS